MRIDTGSEWRVVKEYCDGTELRIRGKVTITAEKIVDGHVTGNPERPAIPIDPDAATIESSVLKWKSLRSKTPAATVPCVHGLHVRRPKA